MTPGSEDMTGEGREAICIALGSLAEDAAPKLAGLLLELRQAVEDGAGPQDMRAARANFVFRRTDDYWRRRWDAVSRDPHPKYDAQIAAINRMYWARRVAFEWRYPGKWQLGRTV